PAGGRGRGARWAPRPDARGYETPAALSAARTRAGVIGASRIRTPVASKNAFAIAGAIGVVPGSSTPSGSLSVRCTSAFTTLGLSLNRRIGYPTQSRLVTRLLFTSISTTAAADAADPRSPNPHPRPRTTFPVCFTEPGDQRHLEIEARPGIRVTAPSPAPAARRAAELERDARSR